MPATHASDLKSTYAQVAEGYESANAENVDESALTTFIQHLPKNAKILDLGAGVGRDSKWLSAKGFDVTMFDLSPDMLKIAASKVPEAKVIQGDMTELEFANDSFDGVWASASLLHLTKKEIESVLKRVFEILKSEGIFYCSLKKGEGEKEVESDKYGQPMKRFFSFYTEGELEKLLTKAGFSDVQSRQVETETNQAWIHAWGFKNNNS